MPRSGKPEEEGKEVEEDEEEEEEEDEALQRAFLLGSGRAFLAPSAQLTAGQQTAGHWGPLSMRPHVAH